MAAARTSSTDTEWLRARRQHGVYACDRYRWLRPADAQRIALQHPDTVQLTHVSERSNGEIRSRAPRVDEARAILDVQYPIDDVHPLDRMKAMRARFYFQPETMLLTVHRGGCAHELHELYVVTTQQQLGERHWWVCPTCGNRRKHLYYFIAGYADLALAPRRVLACRTCLGFTYASRSRHRCPDHDERQT